MKKTTTTTTTIESSRLLSGDTFLKQHERKLVTYIYCCVLHLRQKIDLVCRFNILCVVACRELDLCTQLKIGMYVLTFCKLGINQVWMLTLLTAS